MFGSKDQIFRTKALERLASPDDLDELIQIVRPKDWIAVMVVGSLVVLATAWAIGSRVATTVAGRGVLVHSTVPAVQVPGAGALPDTTGVPGRTLINVSYVPIGAGRKIQPGMPVQVTPDTVERERFGGITGVVASVSPAPVSMDRAAERVGSTELARELLRGEPCFEVIARLDGDPTTISQHRWSFSRGPAISMSAGLTTSMRVTVETRRPIEYILPFLREIPGID